MEDNNKDKGNGHGNKEKEAEKEKEDNGNNTILPTLTKEDNDNNTIPPTSTKRKNPYKCKSYVWEHFKKRDKKEGDKKEGSSVKLAICNYCKKELKCDSKNGTSTLKRHLDTCSKFPDRLIKDPKHKLLAFTSNDGAENNVVNWKFDQELCRKTLAQMLILDELPFKFVEHEGFKIFCQTLQPRFQILSRTTMRKDCKELYNSEKQKLKGVFTSGQRVCITTDMWTSIQTLGYMSLSAHYIDKEWKLHKKIINFQVVPTPHKADQIANAVEQCLISWGIEKLFTITVDNCYANDGVVQSLKRKFNKKNGLVMSGEFIHLRCCAHIVNLIVKEGINEIKKSISQIRSAVKYVRGSPSRLQTFKKAVADEKIISKKVVCLDVDTRWNSTYLMLDAAIVFEKAFDRLEEQESQYIQYMVDLESEPPNEEDWSLVRVLCKFLENFYVTKRLSGSKYVTSNLYFHEVFGIEMLLREWSDSQESFLHDMGVKMKAKFDKYWGSTSRVNLLLVIVVILDPCYKLKYVKFCYSKLYSDEQMVNGIIGKILGLLEHLFIEYKSFSLDVTLVGEEMSQNHGRVESSGSQETTTVKADDVKLQYRKFLQEEDNAMVKSELERYLEEPMETDDSHFDILNWWKTNQSKYRVLSLMARDILAMPVSTVASESAFSTGGRVLDQFRSSLTPELVECLICTQDWLRISKSPIEIEEKLEESEENAIGI